MQCLGWMGKGLALESFDVAPLAQLGLKHWLRYHPSLGSMSQQLRLLFSQETTNDSAGGR